MSPLPPLPREIARLLDANANRAREAARVMEDLARFVLDRGPLAAELKAIRHELRAIMEGLVPDPAALLAARDTPNDVGARHTTEQERRRADLADVAAAAGKRLAEALRVLEEAAKAVANGAPLADRCKALRYRAYDAEQRLVLALRRRRPGVQWRLCVLVTEALCTRLPWEEVAERAIRGGADCLQLREKSLPDAELLRRARRLVDIAHGTPLPSDPEVPHAEDRRAAVVINDRPDVALLAQASGVHLGQGDLPVEAARRLAGPGLIIGVSTTNADEARAALRAGADVCGVGPMFPSATKHKPSISGPAYLAEYLRLAAEHAEATGAPPVPHLAIGGITPENVGLLAAVGCRGVAVSSAVCGAEDPEAVCRALITSARPV